MERKAFAYRFIITVLVSFAVGCGIPLPDNDEGNGAYARFDMEEYAAMTMLLIGDKPPDLEMVQDALNEVLMRKLNASLTLRYLPWADYTLKYSTLLASADQIDLVYTSDWCFYQREAMRGSFFEMTDEFARTYMENALDITPAAAIRQARIGGKLFMMPKSEATFEGESWFAIRGDLRKKHSLPPIQNVADLERYFLVIATEEPGVVPYDASGEIPLFNILCRQMNNFVYVAGGGYPWLTRFRGAEHIPADDEIFNIYMTPEYEEFVLKMKQYADWGFWSKYALSGVNRVSDSFIGGTSASLIWNSTIFQAGERLTGNNPQWFAEYIDLFPDAAVIRTAYTNDGTAISAFSRDPERAALCIDILKSDIALNELFMGGIEGRHWIDAGEGLYTPGPYAARYPWNHAQWAFNLPLALARESTGMSLEQITHEETKMALLSETAFSDFRFFHDPVKDEWARITELESEYISVLEFGFANDPLAVLEEFREKIIQAGLAKVEDEFFYQYRQWKEKVETG
jgi:putative aldouronate transport system substrate-binding protein